MELNDTELRVLKSLQLQGTMGHCGSLNKKQRLAVLNGLLTKGLINNDCTLTKNGIEASIHG